MAHVRSRFRRLALAAASGVALAGVAAAALAQPTPPQPPAPTQALPFSAQPSTAQPKLLVVISVDQLSADLFAEYRAHYTGGLARLAGGVVFPSAYQAHAATETCPGHSVILTGAHPGRNGIIANNYYNLGAARADKRVYCAEDEGLPAVDGRYAPSVVHLKVPTLGDLMKAQNPASRVVSVAGKDRAAIMMAGAKADQVWWLSPKDGLTSFRGVKPDAIVTATGAAIVRAVGTARTDLPRLAQCDNRAVAIPTAGDRTVGTGRFARAAGDARGFAASPEADGAVMAAAAAMQQAYKLGQRDATDLLILGLSATDYVGHTFGTEGSEMCHQMLWLDRQLGAFFNQLDATGVDYAVALTADHGGHDLPERLRTTAIPEARRVDMKLSPDKSGVVRWLNDMIAKDLKLTGDLVFADASFGDFYFARSLNPAQRKRASAVVQRALSAHGDVAYVFTRDAILATPVPRGRNPELWTPMERVRAGYDPDRSGDLYVLLKPRVTPIPEAGVGYVATHGSAWDYDRRVPLLFWRKGVRGYEQPNPVLVADLMPTLAKLAGVAVDPAKVDGQALELPQGLRPR